MALGKTHDKFNLFLGFVITVILWQMKLPLVLLGCFVLGSIYSTFYFSPDSDLMPKKKLGVFRVFFYPYTMAFKHRGSSHSLIWGTLIRSIYSFALIYFVTWILFALKYITYDPKNYIEFFKEFNLSKIEYKILCWFYIGMFLADAGHILLDKIWSFFKRGR